jgi:hypothetical protein
LSLIGAVPCPNDQVYNTSRPKDRLFGRRPAGWYLIDFARSRHTNPARIPVVVNADWYQTLGVGHRPQAVRTSPSVISVVLRPSSVLIKTATDRTISRHELTQQHAAPRGLLPMAGSLSIYL